MLKTMIFAVVVALLTFSSCKKETIDNKALLTSHKWQITADLENGRDQFATTRACEKDNTWEFTANGFLIVDEGVTKCSANDPQSTTAASWSLTADQKKLNITETGRTASLLADIVELTSTSLRILISDSGQVSEITFKKI